MLYFSGTFYLPELSCPAVPVVLNAQADSTDTRYATDVTLTCITGYSWNTSVDYIIITCQSDATWSNMFDIVAAECIRKMS